MQKTIKWCGDLWGTVSCCRFSSVLISSDLFCIRILQICRWQVHDCEEIHAWVSGHVWYLDDPPGLPQDLEVHGLLQVGLITSYLVLIYLFCHRKGLDAAETTFVMHVYRSHHKVGSQVQIKTFITENAKSFKIQKQLMAQKVSNSAPPLNLFSLSISLHTDHFALQINDFQ